MASTTAPAASGQYTYQRPSTLATRTLVSDSKPAELSSTSSNDTKPSSEAHQQHNTTATSTAQSSSDNYSQAVAAANKSSSSTLSSVSDRPGFDRQQSWSMSDKKRQMAEQMLQGSQGHNVQGYGSTAASS